MSVATDAAPSPVVAAGDGEMAAVNRAFYDALWRDCHLQQPQRFNTWPEVARLARAAADRLEVGPGLRPRLPIAGTVFVDLSAVAVARLSAAGGDARVGEAGALPFADGAFDLVCALDVVEHVAVERAVFAELARVCRPGGTLLLSVPLHAHAWSAFDTIVGHFRRYEPDQLRARIADHGFSIQRSAIFGMQPENTAVLRFGMWWLLRFRRAAMFFYNRLFMPIGLRLQKPLVFSPGLIDPAGVDEVFMICRRDTVAR